MAAKQDAPPKILIVDDEPDLQLIVQQNFRPQILSGEYEFLFAENGVEALEIVDANDDLHIVLTDINMPEMDGLTLLKELSKRGNPLMRAVIVSAYGDMKNIRTAMNFGAYDFVLKPIDFDDLEITINKTIKEVYILKDALNSQEKLIALEQELSLASEIQQSILPQIFPDNENYEIYAEMIPAKNIGGDFFDFFQIDDKRLGLVIGDVSGKGMPSALYMAVSRSLLKSTALTGVSPADCFSHVNTLLSQDNTSRLFVTVFYGILHLDTGELVYSNGGHNLPYMIRRDGTVEAIAKTGNTVLGFLEYLPYDNATITMAPGDSLLLYTDGITEAMNANKDFFAEERLETALKTLSDVSSKQIVSDIIKETQAFAAGFPQSDDITGLAVTFLNHS